MSKGDQPQNLYLSVIGIPIALVTTAAWASHVYVSMLAGAWLFAGFATLLFPVGMVHGFSIWLGMPWV